jgi:hypothetical protein
MSLEDKIISPMAPAELPGQRSEPLPKSGKKRRKNGGNAGAALGKPKKDDLDDEVGGDSTAVLTLGASDEARRPQKKMLFESASDGATRRCRHHDSPEDCSCAASRKDRVRGAQGSARGSGRQGARAGACKT